MRIIDADALHTHKFLTPQVKVIGGRHNGNTREQIIVSYQKGWNDCIDAIVDNAPTVEDRPQGEWEEDSGNIACSHCHTIWLYRRTDFCPNCGTKMKKDTKQ